MITVKLEITADSDESMAMALNKAKTIFLDCGADLKDRQVEESPDKTEATVSGRLDHPNEYYTGTMSIHETELDRPT